MVDESSDPSVVAARIARETRNSVVLKQQLKQQKEAEAKLYKVEYLEANPVSRDQTSGTLDATSAHEVQPAAPMQDPLDGETYYRRGRLGVVAVLVLVLFWAWLKQRRGA